MDVIGVSADYKTIRSLNLVRDVYSIYSDKRKVCFLTRWGILYQIMNLKDLTKIAAAINFEQVSKSQFVNVSKISKVTIEINNYKKRDLIDGKAYIKNNESFHFVVSSKRVENISVIVNERSKPQKPHSELPMSLISTNKYGEHSITQLDLLNDISHVETKGAYLAFYNHQDPYTPLDQINIMNGYANIMKDSFFLPDSVNLVNATQMNFIKRERNQGVIHFIGSDSARASISQNFLKHHLEEYEHLIIKD